MNTAIISGGSSFGGRTAISVSGFRPVNLAKNVVDQIIKTGKVSRGYMGVKLQPLTPDLAHSSA